MKPAISQPGSDWEVERRAAGNGGPAHPPAGGRRSPFGGGFHAYPTMQNAKNRHPRKGDSGFLVPVAGVEHRAAGNGGPAHPPAGGRRSPFGGGFHVYPTMQNAKNRHPRKGDSGFLVPVAGVEPARCRHRRILNPVRLPIPSHRRVPVYYTWNGRENQVKPCSRCGSRPPRRR